VRAQRRDQLARVLRGTSKLNFRFSDFSGPARARAAPISAPASCGACKDRNSNTEFGGATISAPASCQRTQNPQVAADACGVNRFWAAQGAWQLQCAALHGCSMVSHGCSLCTACTSPV
jgi:hypothetical protein